MNNFIDVNDAEKYMNDVINHTLNKTIYDSMMDDVNIYYNQYLEYINELKDTNIKDIPVYFNNISTIIVDEENGLKLDNYKNKILWECVGYNDKNIKKAIEYRLLNNFCKYSFNTIFNNEITKINEQVLYKIKNKAPINHNSRYIKVLGDIDYNKIYKILFYENLLNKIIKNKLNIYFDSVKFIENKFKNHEELTYNSFKIIETKMKKQEEINNHFKSIIYILIFFTILPYIYIIFNMRLI